MKKVIFGMMSLATMALAFTSCSSDDEQALAEPGTAIIKGRVTANLDETSIEPQNVPAGTNITFIIDGRDLDPKPDPNYQYDRVTRTAEVDADGRYEVSVPARKAPVNVRVEFDAFEFDATIITTNEEGFQETVNARRVFRAGVIPNLSVTAGQTVVRDYRYTMDGDDFVSSATIRGAVTAQINDNIGSVTRISNIGSMNQISGSGSDTLLSTGGGYVTQNNVEVTGGTGTGMTVNIQAEAIGRVMEASVKDGGESYFANSLYNTTTTGNGTGLQVRVTAVDAGNNNAITSIEIWGPARGTGYAIGDVVTLVGGNNLGTVEITEVTEGKVMSVSINQPGEDYTFGDVVTISGGTGATFDIKGVSPRQEPVPANVVLSFTTLNGGSNGVRYRTTTNEDGEYIIKVPVTTTNGNDNIQVRGVTFETNSTFMENGEFVIEPRVYRMNQTSVNVFTEDIVERDFTYNRQP